MSDLQKVGPSLLEMDDITQYLNTKGLTDKDKNGNETDYHPFITDKDKATDTKLVGGVDAARIAISTASTENGNDRTTIRNAMNLDGHPADYFLTSAKGSGIVDTVDDIRTIYNQAIRSLRDELYQLRAELARTGIVESYQANEGFYDTFRTNHPLHEEGEIARAIKESNDQYHIIVQEDKYAKFAVGDRMLIKDLTSGTDAVVTVTEKKPDMETLTFTPGAGFDIHKDKCVIYKSKGSNINGSFIFGEVTPVAPGDKEYYTGLDDDTYSMRRSIMKSHTGFGYSFRIPTVMQKNYLANLGIKVKKFGTPGALMCYIIDERNVQNWKNLARAFDDGIIVAQSQPLDVDAAQGEYIAQFDFFDGSSYPRLVQADDSEHKIRYCAIIEALEADADNRYEIVFLQNKREDGTFGDLQLNNTTYNYAQKENQSIESALATDTLINASDLYIDMKLKQAVESSFIPFHDGIYTAHFTTNHPVAESYARITMRIAREGMFTVDAHGTTFSGGDADAVGDAGAIIVKGDTNDDVRGFDRCVGKNVVFGTSFRKAKEVNENRIVVFDGLPVKAGDPVYPVNYQVKIKAKRREWKNVEAGGATKYVAVDSDTYAFDLPLVAVMPDGVHRNADDSDRLIFEAPMTTDTGIQFNDFEVQVYWEQSAQAVSNHIVGGIRTLDVALERLP